MGKRSEYRSHYKRVKNVGDIYAERLKYRHIRRDLEYSHHPWAWYEDEENDSSDDSSTHQQPNSKKEASTSPQHFADRNRTPIAKSDSYNEYLSESNYESDYDGSDHCENSDDEIERIKRKAVERALKRDNRRVSNSEYEEDYPVSDEKATPNYSSRRKRPVHPRVGARPVPPINLEDRNAKKRSPSGDVNERKSSSGLGKDSRVSGRTNTSNINNKSFWSYGYGNPNKKTFNVSSDIDVYASALRAQKRQQAEIHKKQKTSQLAALGRRPVTASYDYNGRPVVENPRSSPTRKSDWMSEYKLQFPGYNPALYQQNRSKIAGRCRSSTPELILSRK